MTLEYRPRVCKSKLNQMGDAAVVVGVCGSFKPFSRSSSCVVNEIQLQRQVAGIASRYYGQRLTPAKARRICLRD